MFDGVLVLKFTSKDSCGVEMVKCLVEEYDGMAAGNNDDGLG